jgi:hypothetical protein
MDVVSASRRSMNAVPLPGNFADCNGRTVQPVGVVPISSPATAPSFPDSRTLLPTKNK